MDTTIVPADAFDLLTHLRRQSAWAQQTFGPGPRTAALLDHIRKELAEIAADPGDTREWLDVVILALEGAMRTGATPGYIADALAKMQERNEARKWPDWRTAPPDVASEHDRTAECQRVIVDPLYRWGRGACPGEDLPRELAAAGVKSWDYHIGEPGFVMVYVDHEADAAAVARAVWRGLLTVQVSGGTEAIAHVDNGGQTHIIRFSRIGRPSYDRDLEPYEDGSARMAGRSTPLR